MDREQLAKWLYDHFSPSHNIVAWGEHSIKTKNEWLVDADELLALMKEE